MGLKPVAVELDLMQPLGAGWGLLREVAGTGLSNAWAMPRREAVSYFCPPPVPV
jgi:hypothetical protein